MKKFSFEEINRLVKFLNFKKEGLNLVESGMYSKPVIKRFGF